jgi:integrase
MQHIRCVSHVTHRRVNMDMPSDLKHILKRHKAYYARVAIPPTLRTAFGGRTSIVRTLETRSLSEAQRKRHKVVDELKALIETKRVTAVATSSVSFDADLASEAIAFFKRMEKASDAGEHDKAGSISVEMIDRSFEVEAKRGKAAGDTLFQVANGATSLRQHFETWMNERKFTPRSRADHNAALRKLEIWMEGQGLTLVVTSVTNKIAGNFKIEEFSKKNVHHKTANKHLSSLRTYWKWLVNHGHGEDGNPWIGLSLPKVHSPPDELERPFTDDEVTRLFNGGADRLMRDAMGIAALSGMRKEEIFQLRVVDCANNTFNIRRSKTNAGIRKVPIHPDLVSTVQARSAGKAQDDFLLHEAKAGGGWGEERSMPFSKRFQTYRVSCGVDELLEGRRRSLVNFHSWRRWFITKADQQGHRREDIERIVGHKVQGMSLGLYSGGASIAQLKVVIESVRLPDAILVDAEARPVRDIKPKMQIKRKLHPKVKLPQRHLR